MMQMRSDHKKDLMPEPRVSATYFDELGLSDVFVSLQAGAGLFPWSTFTGR